MSYVTLTEVKQALRQTQSSDDDLLQRLIDSAESECLRFLGRTELPTLPLEYPQFSSNDELISSEEVPSSNDPVAPDVVNGIILMVMADYDGMLEKRDLYRERAEALWMPYAVRDRMAL